MQARHGNSREYFSEAKYGHASPRLIADGQPIPHGGGQYLVGHPYVIAGHAYYPSENEFYVAVGMASWYGDAFQGRRTANGEIYDKESISAAHPTMPLPSYARVTNLGNGHSIIVRVNDRGPYHGGRVMDVSSRVADALDFKGAGTARVKVEYIGKASLEGSDDSRLLATLRLDGAPATLDGLPDGRPVMVASSILAPVESLAGALTAAPARLKPARLHRPRRWRPSPSRQRKRQSNRCGSCRCSRRPRRRGRLILAPSPTRRCRCVRRRRRSGHRRSRLPDRRPWRPMRRSISRIAPVCASS